MSYISLDGRLTKEPKEYIDPKTNDILAFLDIADNTTILNKTTNEWEQKGVQYYNLTLKGNQAIDALAQLKKGDKIHAEGYLTYNEYTTESGEKHTTNKINVQKISRPLTKKTTPQTEPLSETPPF